MCVCLYVCVSVCMHVCLVSGCTDPVACNFMEDATENDGSCTYETEIHACGGGCWNDSDGDGVCDEEEG